MKKNCAASFKRYKEDISIFKHGGEFIPEKILQREKFFSGKTNSKLERLYMWFFTKLRQILHLSAINPRHVSRSIFQNSRSNIFHRAIMCKNNNTSSTCSAETTYARNVCFKASEGVCVILPCHGDKERRETSNLKGSRVARDWSDGVGVNVISRNAWLVVAWVACFYRSKASSFITDLASGQSHVQVIQTAYRPGLQPKLMTIVSRFDLNFVPRSTLCEHGEQRTVFWWSVRLIFDLTLWRTGGHSSGS